MTRIFLLICCALLLPAAGRANGISVQTVSATDITTTSATLHGLVSAGVAEATVAVEFGTTPTLGRQKSVGTVSAGFSTVAVSATLTGLIPAQKIYYRFTAQNSSASGAGAVLSFTTLTLSPPGPPTIEQAAPIAEGGTFARIAARIDPHGTTTSAYATCQTAGGPLVFAQLIPAISGDGPMDVVFEFRGLSRLSAYSFEIIATNSLGTANFTGSFRTVRNVPPTAADSVGYVVRGGTTVVTLAISDPDGDPLSFQVESRPAFGPITYLGGRVAYTAGPGFRGEDRFTYIVGDGFGGSARATVFLRNPFLENAGGYDAALVRTGAEKANGVVKITVGRQGTFTGELWTDGVRFPLLGSFRLGGRFDETVRAGDLAVRVQLMVDPITRALTGMVTGRSGTSSLQAGMRRVAEPAAQAGRYTSELDAPACAENPNGHGWTTLKVSPNGLAKFAGRLACGRHFLASAPLREDGSVLLPIAPDPGFVLLKMFFASAPEYDLAGDEFPFALPTDPASSPRPPINGSRYFAPGITHSLLRFSDTIPALIDLHFSPSPTSFVPDAPDAVFAVQDDGTFLLQSTQLPEVGLGADLATGIFFGRAVTGKSPATSMSFNGVFLQKRNVGSGLLYSRSNGAFSSLGEARLAPR